MTDPDFAADEIAEPAPNPKAVPLSLNPRTKTPTLWFTIPQSALPHDSGWDGDVSFGIVALGPEDELDAAKAAAGDDGILTYELVKASLRRIQEPGRDRRNLNRGELEHEEVWGRVGPKGRTCMVIAFKSISAPTGPEVTVVRESFRWEE